MAECSCGGNANLSAPRRIFLYRIAESASWAAIALVAQLVEHLICNQGVAGSNPAGGTICQHIQRSCLEPIRAGKRPRSPSSWRARCSTSIDRAAAACLPMKPRQLPRRSRWRRLRRRPYPGASSGEGRRPRRRAGRRADERRDGCFRPLRIRAVRTLQRHSLSGRMPQRRDERRPLPERGRARRPASARQVSQAYAIGWLGSSFHFLPLLSCLRFMASKMLLSPSQRRSPRFALRASAEQRLRCHRPFRPRPGLWARRA